MKITNKHKAVKKGDEDEKKQAAKRIRRHDFDSPTSKNGRANLKRSASRTEED